MQACATLQSVFSKHPLQTSRVQTNSLVPGTHRGIHYFLARRQIENPNGRIFPRRQPQLALNSRKATPVHMNIQNRLKWFARWQSAWMPLHRLLIANFERLQAHPITPASSHLSPRQPRRVLFLSLQFSLSNEFLLNIVNSFPPPRRLDRRRRVRGQTSKHGTYMIGRGRHT